MPNPILTAAVLLVLCITLLSGCGASNRGPQKLPTQRMTIPLGQAFQIPLGVDPASGYLWQQSRRGDETIVRRLNESFQRTTRTATPGHQVWTFLAVGRGETQLEFEYIKQVPRGEIQPPPTKTKTFVITVQ